MNMLQSNEPLFEAVGGIHIGESFIKSFQASKPYGKIEVYQDKIVLKIQYISDSVLRMFEMAGRIPFMPGTYKYIPREIELPYAFLEGYKKINRGILGYYGINFIHLDNRLPPFLQIWLRKKDASQVIYYLDTIGLRK